MKKQIRDSGCLTEQSIATQMDANQVVSTMHDREVAPSGKCKRHHVHYKHCICWSYTQCNEDGFLCCAVRLLCNLLRTATDQLHSGGARALITDGNLAHCVKIGGQALELAL